QTLQLKDAKAGTFRMTILSGGDEHAFDLDRAQRLLRLFDGGQPPSSTIVALAYFEQGRTKTAVDVIVGTEQVLSYEDVARRAAEKTAQDRSSAIGFGAFGTLLILLGGLARLARGSPHQAPAPNRVMTLGAICWLAFYGTALIVIVTEPTILH